MGIETPQREREVRTNRRVRAPEVRLIGADGIELGIMTSTEALRRAEEEGLDLVEVSPKAMPPVCRLLNYGKYKYLQKKKAVDAKQSQAAIAKKELRFSYKIDDHDVQTKLRRAQEFLSAGNPVRLVMVLHGRERSHADLGRARVAEMVKSLSCKAGMITQEGKNIMVDLQKV